MHTQSQDKNRQRLFLSAPNPNSSSRHWKQRCWNQHLVGVLPAGQAAKPPAVAWRDPEQHLPKWEGKLSASPWAKGRMSGCFVPCGHQTDLSQAPAPAPSPASPFVPAYSRQQYSTDSIHLSHGLAGFLCAPLTKLLLLRYLRGMRT